MKSQGNCNSKVAKKVNDQYFTPVDTAKWCFEAVVEATGWDFVGTALEPAVGGFAFVQAAQELGLRLQWTTNDLFPQPDVTPDTTLDFVKGDFANYDYVVTNPPFGHSNMLARQFMKKALTLSDKVVMLLPKGARRLGFQDAMPRHSRRIFDRSLFNETFEIPGHAPRTVSTCVQAWERTTTPQPTLRSTLDLRSDLITIWAAGVENTYLNHPKHGTADAQVCRWGRMGKPRDTILRSGAWESVHFNSKKLDWPTFSRICSTLDFSDFEELSTAVPAFDVPVFLHRFNTRAVELGLL